MSRKAIVTAVIGQRHRELWQTSAQQTWERYAAKHDYSIIVIDRPIDSGPLAEERSLAWQKLLILSLPQVQQYDRVVWLDSDILINDSAAPCVASGVPEDRIGAVRDQVLLSHPSLAIPYARINKTHDPPAEAARCMYDANGLSPHFDYFLNTGVLVLSPPHHQVLLETIYRQSRQTRFSYSEQVGLSHEILRQNLHHPIDPRFNTMWLEYKASFYPFLLATPSLLPLCLAAAMSNNFFLHFAGLHDEIKAWNPEVQITDQVIGIPMNVIREIRDGTTQMIASRDH